ncbi:MAG: hypothetical protein QME78_02405 [Thermodesulfobacteriota bacterium]|nr:hypothetical protein [Thermodesulfobacteriota bacterium]
MQEPHLIEDYAQSVIRFMDKMKMDKAILCGNSVGALMSKEVV